MNAIVHESRGLAPAEACGILYGDAARVDGWTVARNVAADPYRHFEIDPAALIAAYRAERAGGAGIIGWWHSHPSGDPAPSPADAVMAAPDGRLWLIVGRDDVCAWRAVADGQLHGRFNSVRLIKA